MRTVAVMNDLHGNGTGIGDVHLLDDLDEEV